jgi:hypothetical protein
MCCLVDSPTIRVFASNTTHTYTHIHLDKCRARDPRKPRRLRPSQSPPAKKSKSIGKAQRLSSKANPERARLPPITLGFTRMIIFLSACKATEHELVWDSSWIISPHAMGIAPRSIPPRLVGRRSRTQEWILVRPSRAPSGRR